MLVIGNLVHVSACSLVQFRLLFDDKLACFCNIWAYFILQYMKRLDTICANISGYELQLRKCSTKEMILATSLHLVCGIVDKSISQTQGIVPDC